MPVRILKKMIVRCLFGVLLLLLSTHAYSQKKDTTNTFKIKKSVSCQATLAGKLTRGKDSTYIPIFTMNEIIRNAVVGTAGCTDYTITSFSMKATYAEGSGSSTIQLPSNGDRLTSAMFRLLDKLKPGGKAVINYIQYSLPNGQTGTLPDITFMIDADDFR
jgi:hypothetical protein